LRAISLKAEVDSSIPSRPTNNLPWIHEMDIAERLAPSESLPAHLTSSEVEIFEYGCANDAVAPVMELHEPSENCCADCVAFGTPLGNFDNEAMTTSVPEGDFQPFEAPVTYWPVACDSFFVAVLTVAARAEPGTNVQPGTRLRGISLSMEGVPTPKTGSDELRESKLMTAVVAIRTPRWDRRPPVFR
jgi:hypothetical protein